jgi:tetrahydromethanopterin S-methyltransferase subunit G
MNCKDALGILEKRRYRDCPRWQAYIDDHVGQYVIGFEASGKSTGSFSVFEAIAIAEKLQAERPAIGSHHKFAKNGEDLPQLEWRKQVDERLDTLAVAFDKFSEDTCCQVENLIRDTKSDDYRITAWGECLSDALKKTVAQDERIAKLEAKLDEFEAIETVDEIVGRLAAIESRLNFTNSVTFKVIDKEHEKLNSRIDQTVDSETFDDLEKRVTGLERRLVNAYLSGKI